MVKFENKKKICRLINLDIGMAPVVLFQFQSMQSHLHDQLINVRTLDWSVFMDIHGNWLEQRIVTLLDSVRFCPYN